MSNEFELPTEGIKIYSPQKGWQDQPQTLVDGPPLSPPPGQDLGDRSEDHPSEGLDEEPEGELHAGTYSDPDARIDAESAGQTPQPPPDQRASPLASESPDLPQQPLQQSPDQHAHSVELVHDQAAALAEVGGSLHALFEALQRPLVPSNVIDAGPSWRDVADLSYYMEDRLAEREELLARLRGIEDEIRGARGGLLEALAYLAAQEQRNLEAAQIRADVSAMAAQVIARRFSDSAVLGAPPSD